MIPTRLHTADGLISAAWDEALQPTGVDDDSSTTAWSTALGRSLSTAAAVETLIKPSLDPIYKAPSFDSIYSTPSCIQDTTQPTTHQQPEVNTVPTQPQQQPQQQQVLQVATTASPGVAQQGPTRDLGTPGTETNVEFMSGYGVCVWVKA